MVIDIGAQEIDFRSNHVKDLPPSPLGSLRELSFPGRKTINLLSGDVGYEPPEELKVAYSKAVLENGANTYAPVLGFNPLREEIAKNLTRQTGVKFERDDIILTSGGQNALFCTHMVVIDPGDEVLSLAPYWTPIENHAKTFHGRLVSVPMDRNFSFDPSKLERAVTSRTKALYVNSPNNPSGRVLQRFEIEQLADIARKRNLLVISDEPYSSVIYEGEHFSMASIPGMEKRTLIASSYSKTHNITGWRQGFVASKNRKLISAFPTCVIQTTATGNHPAQRGLAYALQRGLEPNKENLEDMRIKRDLLVNGLNSIDGIECVMPQGTFYAFPCASDLKRKFPKKGVDKEAFSRLMGMGFPEEMYSRVRDSYSWQIFYYLLNVSSKYALVVAPGREFGSDFDEYFRVSFAKPTREEIEIGLNVLREAFNN